jgi:hypothetical protein
MKRNRPAAMVSTPKTFNELTAKANEEQSPSSALDWLLNNANVAMTPKPLREHAMKNRLDDLKNDWPER